MKAFEPRTAYFDRLVDTPGLKWLGQNTDHAAPHRSVAEAMLKRIRDEEYHIHAPPAGLGELRAEILSDLGSRVRPRAVGTRRRRASNGIAR